jgi:hypothetical protein
MQMLVMTVWLVKAEVPRQLSLFLVICIFASRRERMPNFMLSAKQPPAGQPECFPVACGQRQRVRIDLE